MARTLVYDIETAPNTGLYFGARWDVSITKIIQHGYVLGFAWKYLDKPTVHSCYIWDFPLYETEPRNDVEVVKRWAELAHDADIVVGHNVDGFDTRVMVGRMLVHHLPPIPMPQSADTWKIAKRVAKFDSNKLDDLGEAFGLGRKIKTDASLWWGCMNGDEKARRDMVRYNKQDVRLTEKVYLHLLPFDSRHPNLAVIEGRPAACPRCAAESTLVAQGVRRTKVGVYRQFKCSKCLSWSSSRLAEKVARPEHV